jgi:phosphomannomutase
MLRLVNAIGRYFIEVLQVSSVVVGRDARLAAPPLIELALEVFCRYGLRCCGKSFTDFHLPILFRCMQNPQSAAVMFTASHNQARISG